MAVQVVTFKCTLWSKTGEFISSSMNQDVIADSEAPGGQLKGLSQILVHIKAGEVKRIQLPANEAYGFYDPDKVVTLQRSEFEELKNIHLGETIHVDFQSGRTLSCRVTSIDESAVTLDGNHPLAGQDLVFEIEAITCRPVGKDEIPVKIDKPLLH